MRGTEKRCVTLMSHVDTEVCNMSWSGKHNYLKWPSTNLLNLSDHREAAITIELITVGKSV